MPRLQCVDADILFLSSDSESTGPFAISTREDFKEKSTTWDQPPDAPRADVVGREKQVKVFRSI